MAVRRLYPMLNGHEIVDKSLSTRDRGGVIIHAPIQMFLLDTTDGWILFDTGANPVLVRDAALRKRYYDNQGWEAPVLPEELTLSRHLERLALTPQRHRRRGDLTSPPRPQRWSAVTGALSCPYSAY